MGSVCFLISQGMDRAEADVKTEDGATPYSSAAADVQNDGACETCECVAAIEVAQCMARSGSG